MYSYHHTTIIFHTMSVATVRSQFATITRIIVSSVALRTLLAGLLWSARGVCILPGANVCNIKLHLFGGQNVASILVDHLSLAKPV